MLPNSEPSLVSELHVAPLPLELCVVDERFELAESHEVAQPFVVDAFSDELREAGITDRDEAARRNTVSHVAEFFRRQLGEIAQHRLLQQVGLGFP
jgi:hypothetical protein